MILVIDNYDSFTWNLVDILQRHVPTEVRRNDKVTIQEIKSLNPKGILISPGPGRPEDSGISVEAARHFAGKIPILGICLGHQVLGELFGMKLIHAETPMHGKTSMISHDGAGLFRNLPNPLRVMRYHSLLLDNQNVPETLIIRAQSLNGEVMGLRHKFLNFAGLQFHPESILTESGWKLIENWLEDIGLVQQ